MITLYHGTGATDFTLLGGPTAVERWTSARSRSIRLLRARGSAAAANLLESSAGDLYDAVNHFNDDFAVLVLTLPIAEYLRIADDQATWQPVFRDIAETLGENGLYVRMIAVELSDALISEISSPEADPSEATIARALRDGEQLLLGSGPQSALDRFYTALHGRLLAMARSIGSPATPEVSITDLYKQIRAAPTSPVTPTGPRAADVERVLSALATIVDSLKPLRNKGTLVHPADSLLSEPEASLAVNVIKALLLYFAQKR